MKKLHFKININATAAKVWQVLWNDTTYRKWTSAFQEGSYAVSDWKEGSRVQFLTPDGGGMFSIISECRANELMEFTHLGVIRKFEEQPLDDETKAWSGGKEIYSLTEDNGSTTLLVALDAFEAFQEYFQGTFPKAMALVKDLAEQPIVITVEALIGAPIEKAWRFWTSPEHITKWNNASDDWHTPYTENDLQAGGKFLSRMEARDGSFGFDFWGIYDEVKINELIGYTMGDGRKARIEFIAQGDKCKIVESFEAEEENSLELQQGGWQAILNNFKKYTETN
jgi:uncharacterized protein YndB with AHSA1/START domain